MSPSPGKADEVFVEYRSSAMFSALKHERKFMFNVRGVASSRFHYYPGSNKL